MTLHHYTGASLGNIWLDSGYERHETKWGQGTSYSDIDGLFRAITIELCTSPHRIEPEGVRFLRKRLSLTQEELGAELGCTGQAVAKWEKGETPLPVAAARLLRVLVLKAVLPDLPIGKALGPYGSPAADRLVFSFAPATGWACRNGEVMAVSKKNMAPSTFTTVMLSHLGTAGKLHLGDLAKLVVNDHRYGHHETKRIAAAY